MSLRICLIFIVALCVAIYFMWGAFIHDVYGATFPTVCHKVFYTEHGRHGVFCIRTVRVGK